MGGEQASYKIRAVFFDRDGTLCHRSEVRDREFRQWAQERSRYDPVPFSSAQAKVWDEFFASHQSDMVVDVGVEARFWVAFWQRSLELLGMDMSYLDEALERFVFFKFSEIYPETQAVLSVLYEQGFWLGVISDSFPSLGDSLSYLRLDRFFHVVVDSASTGATKPSAAIYHRALHLLNLEPEEGLFIDDVYANVEGARRAGMQALWLDRAQSEHRLAEGTIADLRGVLAYLGL